jgi:chromosome segregation protein
MLKRLELVGFKSFADKTQFEFAAGITAIVGPNGSGKSNVVDAVRWILGEQSAKSLRGGEMADVIFNGSSSRRSFGLAEVTMTFDNSRRILATADEEVQVSRRVYRSGEGEYLINNQICRLKDVKELFLGSGAGADAYCIIEQGKVDVLLQASTRERRTIFEEAAGISRFKAKKIETLRKLERVDQNVQRLQDIIEEVEKQLRSVKLQAAKAQRYQEHNARLKELRVGLGLDEYRQQSERLEAETAVLSQLKAGLAERTSQVEAWDRELRQLEELLTGLDDGVRQQEGLLADARQQIAAEETTLAHEWSLADELEADLSATRTRMTQLNAHVAGLAEAATRAAEELSSVEAQGDQQRGQVDAFDKELQAIVQRLTDLHTQVKADQAEHLEQMRRAARLHNDAVSYQAQVDNLRRERDRLLHKSEQAAEHLANVDQELLELSQADEELQRRLAAARQGLADQRQQQDRLRKLRDEMTQIVADLRAQRSGLVSRIEVLERLEAGHEGLGTGVGEVMTILEQEKAATSLDANSNLDRPWQSVLGIIADFLTVRREYAPLIDLALGERAQRFLVRNAARLLEALRGRPQPLTGRVSFLPLSAPARRDSGIAVSDLFFTHGFDESQGVGMANPVTPGGTPIHPGVIGVAEHLVTCDHPDLADLPTQLLGNTLIVNDVDTARTIAANTTGFRFVTLQGEVLEADGTLTVGTHHAETGILSRKSELRELRQQLDSLDQRIAESERDLTDVGVRVTAMESHLATLQEEIEVLAEQASDLRSRIGQRRQRREGLHEEVTLSRREISAVERDVLGLNDAWQEALAQAQAADAQVQALQTRLADAERELRDREHQRQQHEQRVTSAKVALAQIEERLTGLRGKHRQLQNDWEQRRQECRLAEERRAASCSRLEESQRTMLHASTALARWYVQKESAERQIVELTAAREVQRQQRHELSERTLAIRNEWQACQEQAHARELETNDLKYRRDTLADRLREDYQIELAELYQRAIDGAEPAGAVEPHVDPSAANEEIAELRRKLARLGSVNLDSLQELADLEARAGDLHTQFDDLTAAKRSLEEIIATINQDSRRLFSETFASIRTHFQELFRMLFGGGMADILLEDENDILESGIEIIARPPGKELRSISLMSGGEKTLTAVALLLAIFRSKPSPFCILDEVDAALDEANIGRFTAVLRDFLDRSQFIIITHSKKTMAVADVLYGVTMQESGVSKRVAVRFEDWVEDGQAAPAEVASSMRNGDESH